jgi:hypothetical protein
MLCFLRVVQQSSGIETCRRCTDKSCKERKSKDYELGKHAKGGQKRKGDTGSRRKIYAAETQVCQTSMVWSNGRVGGGGLWSKRERRARKRKERGGEA